MTYALATGLSEARGDMTTRTALLEARIICGDANLFADLLKRYDADILQGTAPDFVAAKLAERDDRHQKQGASRYLVEPNVKEGKGGPAMPGSPRAIDLLTGEFAKRSRTLSGFRLPRLAVGLAAAIVVLQLGLTAYDTLRLERERGALEAEREALFRSAFPEATTVVDPALQMARNLGALKRARGEAADDDFLAQVTRASQAGSAPARALTWAAGKLTVDRAPKAAAK